MPNISEWPNDAAVCSLSQVLEKDSIPQRYFLSSMACAGILRRAANRGKKLPAPLRAALEQVASPELTKPAADTYSPSIQCYGGGNTSGAINVAACLTAKGQRIDFEVETFAVQAPSYAIQAGALRTNPLSGPDGVGVQEHIAYTLEARAEVQAVCVTGEITHTLKAEGFDASEDGTGRDQPIIASFAFAQNSRDEVRLVGGDGEVSGALAAEPGMKQTTYVAPGGMAVRRLTPRECERLQGFPDDYTLIPNRGKPMADGPRYKALGNSWAVPKFAWLGERIDAVLRGVA